MHANFEKFVWTGIAAAVAICIGTAPIAAGSNGPKPTQAKPQTHATGAMTHGQSGAKTHGQSVATTHGKPTTTTMTHGKSATATTTHGKSATMTTAKGNSKKTATTTTVAKGNSKKTAATTTAATSTTGGTSTTTGGTTGTTTVTPTSDTTTLSKAQKLLAKNTNLANKLSTQLGIAPGPDAAATLSQYAAGFKNLGQFVAATNVSTNQNIPFADLKAAMTGYDLKGEPITPTAGETTKLLSLGQAIQKLGGTDSTTATETAKTATTQANATITSTGTTTTTTTTTTGKTKKH